MLQAWRSAVRAADAVAEPRRSPARQVAPEVLREQRHHGDEPDRPPHPPARAARRLFHGQIATIFIDGRGMHYVLLVDGRLLTVDDPAAFTVLDDSRA